MSCLQRAAHATMAAPRRPAPSVKRAATPSIPACAPRAEPGASVAVGDAPLPVAEPEREDELERVLEAEVLEPLTVGCNARSARAS